MCHPVQYSGGQYRHKKNQSTAFQLFYCNYGDDGGNMIGGVMYTPGPTASDCPNGDNDGLCTWQTLIFPTKNISNFLLFVNCCLEDEFSNMFAKREKHHKRG